MAGLFLNLKNTRWIQVILFSLGAGLLCGFLLRTFHHYRHHFTYIYTPDHAEVYLDGDCLNYGHPNDLQEPSVELLLMPVFLQPHPYLFLQYFNNLTLRDIDTHEPFWRHTSGEIPNSNLKRYGQTFLKWIGIGERGGFSRHCAMYLTYSEYARDEFILDVDLIMPICARLHMVSKLASTRMTYDADFYMGRYGFALNPPYNNTQFFFVPEKTRSDLQYAFFFKYLTNIVAALILLITLVLITRIALLLLRMAMLICFIRNLGMQIKHLVKLAERIRFLWFALLVSAIGGYLAMILSDTIFHGVPRVNDEGIYLFQAKVFASGKFYVPPPEPVESFKHLGIWWEDRIFSYYTFGHSFLLAIGFLIQRPQIIPPILTALTILFTVLAGFRLYRSKLLGLLAGVLLSSSPLVLLLGASYMSHISSMAANMIFLYLLVTSDETQTRKSTIFAGLAWGISFVIRPVTTMIFSILPLVYWGVRRLIQKKYLLILLFVISAVLISSTAYIHAYQTTGKWELIQKQVEERFEEGNDPTTFWKYLHYNGMWFLQRVFGWPPYLSLIFAFLPFILLTPKMWDWIFLTGFILNAYIYSALAHYGWTHEPRYWSEFVPLIALLSIRGLQRTGEISDNIWHDSRSRWTSIGIGICIMITLIRSSIHYYWPYEKECYRNYCCVFDDTITMINSIHTPNSIVFISGHPDFAYISFFYKNDLDFAGNIIYAIDIDEVANQRLMDKYPDRAVFRVREHGPVEQLR